jgi:hypothetical protein
MLSIEHQQMLVWASRPKREDFNVDNKELDEVIAAIRRAAPEKFIKGSVMGVRRFYDEPRDGVVTPNDGYVRSRMSNTY